MTSDSLFNTRQTIDTLSTYLLQYRWRITLALFFMIFAKLATISIPLLLKRIIDTLDSSNAEMLHLQLPLWLLIGYGGLRFLTAIFNQLRDLVFLKASLNTIRDVTAKVFNHLQYLSLAYHLERQTGALSKDIDRGARGINQLLHVFIFSILPTLFELVVVCFILFSRYQPGFVIVTLTTIICYGFYTYTVSNWRLKFRKKMNEMDSKANTTAIDALINYETVKYFTNEELETRRYDEHLQQWQNASYQSEASLAVLNIGQALIVAVGLSLLLIMAGQGVVAGDLSIGDFVLINAFMLQLYVPLNFLGYVFRTLQNAMLDISRMFSLLDEKIEIFDKKQAKPLTIDRAQVEFDRVSFSYESERRILSNLSFKVKGGSKIAIVGHSGAGKSTISRLLLRFYDVTDGSIRIDKQDIRDVTLKSLRQHIGIVPQDTVLFNDSIEFNIRYGRADASDEQVRQAAKLAYLDHFIESLPKDYQTIVGERGLKLSGGEKQRLAIARTILKNPPILVLDEATSALDSQAEAAIQVALNNIAKHRTTIVIAHRLSTVSDSDQIIVLDQGEIIETGTHQQLLNYSGTYADMWQRQQYQLPPIVK